MWAHLPSQAQEAGSGSGQEVAAAIAHAECSFFGATRERFLPRLRMNVESQAGRLTRQFSTAMGPRPGTMPRSKSFVAAAQGRSNLIDQYIFADLQANNIMPADRTTDLEFI